jgi:hypothetical protein
VFRDGIRQYQFSDVIMNEMWFEYHIDHDIKQNAEMHIHVHWAQKVVDSGGAASAPGVAKWYFEMTFAKGHQQQAFPATITTSVTQTASTTQYMHNIAEVQIASTSPTATQFDSASIETDGLLLVRLYRTPADDTLNQAPFVLNCDLHYEADHVATPQKSPPFR